jgi:hypothetical protein
VSGPEAASGGAATTPRVVETDDEIAIETAPLRLVFRWDGARWSHALEVGGRAVAWSLEVDPGREDPDRIVTPAYQQVSAQRGRDGAQILAVGQTGPHHCSAVFDVRRGPDEAVVAVDVAVRSQGGVRLQALASTYHVALPPGALRDGSPLRCRWDLDPSAGGSLAFEYGGPPTGASQVGLAEAGRGATCAQAFARLDPSSRTQRLLYQWCWHDRW